MKRGALEEMARLRSHQSCISSCKMWGLSSIVAFIALLFAPLPAEYSIYINIMEVCSLLIAAASMGFIALSRKQETDLNSRQMKLFGLSDSNIINNNQIKEDQKSTTLPKSSR